MLLIWFSAQLYRGDLLEEVRACPQYTSSHYHQDLHCAAVNEPGTPFTFPPHAHIKLSCSMWQQKVPTPSHGPSEIKSSNIHISYSSQKSFRRQWMQGDGSVAMSQGRESPGHSCISPAGALNSLGSTLAAHSSSDKIVQLCDETCISIESM